MIYARIQSTNDEGLSHAVFVWIFVHLFLLEKIQYDCEHGMKISLIFL